MIDELQQGLMHGPPLAKLAARLTKKAFNLNLNPKAMGFLGLGTALGAGGSYLSNRPQKSLGGKSWEEDMAEGAVDHRHARPETGLARKVLNRSKEMHHGVAKALREHPGKAAILGGATGLAAGAGVNRMLGLAMRLKGGK